MKKILIATGNPGKLSEIKNFLGDIQNIQFLSLQDINYQGEDCEETGETFEENALQKAKFFYEKTGYTTLAEDSGIIIEALKGELGVKTRRWGAGANATDEEWMDFFLNRMKNETNRNAKFFTAACVYDGKTEKNFSGTCQGKILEQSNTPLEKGIPLSAYFLPEGETKVFSAMSKEEKNKISHRGKAITGVKKFLIE